MVDQEELRKYADTWITIVTVILAVEIAGLFFLYQSTTRGSEKDMAVTLFGFISLSLTGLSLISFLIARDPRSKLDTGKCIDIGICLMASNVGVAITALYVNSLVFSKGNFVIATSLYIVELLGLLIFYPILYRKYTSKI